MAGIALLIAGVTFVQIGSCTIDDTVFSDLMTLAVEALVSVFASLWTS